MLNTSSFNEYDIRWNGKYDSSVNDEIIYYADEYPSSLSVEDALILCDGSTAMCDLPAPATYTGKRAKSIRLSERIRKTYKAYKEEKPRDTITKSVRFERELIRAFDGNYDDALKVSAEMIKQLLNRIHQ